MTARIIGTCSICGGAVVVPSVWYGTIPPVPQCSSCGAVSAQGHGPTIPMVGGSRVISTNRIVTTQQPGDPPKEKR